MATIQRRSDEAGPNALRRTPFGLLGATTRDGKREIGALAEDRSLSLDPELCAKARQDLTTPRNRLAAEIEWLPGLSPKRAQAYCAMLDHDLDALLRGAEAEEPLTRANIVAACIELVSPDTADPSWVELILKLAISSDQVSAESVLKLLNEDRKIAGIAEIQSVESFETLYTERMRTYKDTVREALNRMPTDRMIRVIGGVIETSTDEGTRHAPVLIDELLDSYSLDARPFLEKEAASIGKLVEAIRDNAHIGGVALSKLLDKLEAVVKNWTKVARPIQISMKSRGMLHDLSRDTGYGIRNVAVEIFNEHDLLDEAKRLTSILKTHFSQYPELYERVDEDSQALQKIAEKKAFNDALAPLRALCREAAEEANSNPAQGDMQGRRILLAAPELIAKAVRAGAPTEIVDGAKDEVAYAVVACTIDFGNKTSKWRICQELLQSANQFAVGSQAKERVNSNLQVVEGNIRMYGDLEPIESAPSLYTINGCGVSLYGSTDKDPSSGSYMATYYFVLIFIPIFPICRYRVIATGGSGYRFLGKGPLRTFDKWHIAISIGIILWLFLLN